jgi:hypothetical protein
MLMKAIGSQIRHMAVKGQPAVPTPCRQNLPWELTIVLWGKVGSASANPDVVRRPWRALQFLTCETGGQVWCFAVMLRCCWSLGEVDWDFRMPGELDCKLRTI